MANHLKIFIYKPLGSLGPLIPLPETLRIPPGKPGGLAGLARPPPRVVWLTSDPEPSPDTPSTAIGGGAVPRRGHKNSSF